MGRSSLPIATSRETITIMTDDQRRTLERELWNIANTLRGKIDAADFRRYVLGLVFYKYLSERMHVWANDVLQADGKDFSDLDAATPEGAEMIEAMQEEAVEELGYFLPPADLFGSLAERGRTRVNGHAGFILPDLERILEGISRSTMGHESEEDFEHLFEDLDLNSTTLGRTANERNEIIVRVILHLDAIDFRLSEVEADVLGDAYEYLIGMFAAGAGKKAGEFYTPQAVSTILARIVATGKTRLRSVYDPTCGSGSLLLRVAREVEEVGHFHGQEAVRTTYNLARMNMILHGVSHRAFTIRQGDTLEDPQHEGMTFEAVVANPPFSAKWSASDKMKGDDRFQPWGRLAPASKADYAFITHMLHHLADDGCMAVVMPHGALFRGGAEAEIRARIVGERNWLDAVIGLPANIFYGTTIPTCLLVFKKCRETDDVLFVDASGEFRKGKNQNTLEPAHVDRIVAAYRKREETPRFSRPVAIEQIRANDWNLNITRYVDTFVAGEGIDLGAVAVEIRAARAEAAEADAKIRAFCAELGLEAPA